MEGLHGTKQGSANRKFRWDAGMQSKQFLVIAIVYCKFLKKKIVIAYCYCSQYVLRILSRATWTALKSMNRNILLILDPVDSSEKDFSILIAQFAVLILSIQEKFQNVLHFLQVRDYISLTIPEIDR